MTVLEVLQILGAITTLSVYGSSGAGSGAIGNIAIAAVILRCCGTTAPTSSSRPR